MFMSRQKVLEPAGVEMKEKHVGCSNSVKGLCKHTKSASGGGKLTLSNISVTMRLSQNHFFLQDEGLEAESKVEISVKSQVS